MSLTGPKFYSMLVCLLIMMVFTVVSNALNENPSRPWSSLHSSYLKAKRGLQNLRKRDKREVCTCNQRGTFYDLCHPLPAYNYKCICKRGYSGEFCDKCSTFSYGYPDCKYCSCNVFGSKSSICDDVTGQCNCKARTGGRMCDRCISGYYRFPVCQACSCSGNRTIPETCDRWTGACLCKDHYEGDDCEQCKTGYFFYPECKACNCNPAGSSSIACNASTGQCFCKGGFAGQRCDVCSNGRMEGPNCDILKDAKRNGTGNGATEKGDKNVTIEMVEKKGDNLHDKNESEKEGSKGKNMFCDGLFTCNAGNYGGASTCRDLFYNDTESRISSCVPCGCFGEGTLTSLLKCDKSNGKCPCKNHVTGQRCDMCKDGYYGIGHGKLFGCSTCQCDFGASTSRKCDDSGRCTCRRNISGKKCDRLKKGNYFLPSPYDMKFELEDGKLDDGNHVAYGYSHVVFPGYSWKGYVPFGHDQESVTLKINIMKKNQYKIALRYVLSAKRQSNGSLTIRKMAGNKVLQQYRGKFNFEASEKDLFQGKYSSSPDLSSIDLDAGDWELRVSSTSTVLYLDHVVLVPEDYYNPKEVLLPLPKQCHVDISWHETCSMYEYLSIEEESFHTLKGKSGFVTKAQRITDALVFDDPDMTRLLNLESLAMISANQVAVHFNISVNVTGNYNILVEYFNADQRFYRIELIVGSSNNGDHWMASRCSFKFLCRSVVLTDRNVQSVFHFSSEKVTILGLTGAVEGMIGIHKLIAIPVDLYTDEYIQPKFKCLFRDDRCLPNPKLPTLSGAGDLTSANGHIFTGSLPSSTWWVVILQYRQPKYPMFRIEMVVRSSQETITRYLEIGYCPSNIGCRINTSFYANRGTLKVIIKRPVSRDFFVDAISILQDAYLDRSDIDPTHLDMSAEYRGSCLDANSLPLAKTLQPFCHRTFFTQVSNFHDGASTCRCHPRGSRGSQCDKSGGKCNCGPNIVGRRCQSCRAGFFNYPYCRNCRCFMVGSKAPECNRNGQCICKPRFGGSKCASCKSGKFYAFPECKPCQCNTYGSLSLFCDSQTGQCQCLHNFRGRKCDQCQTGFYDFPRCLRCSCFVAGVKTDVKGKDTCFPGAQGKCLCKENVKGDLCDECKDLFFNLQLSNPLGCSPCKCDTAGTLSGITSCDRNTGHCPCKPNVDQNSRACDTCKEGYYGLSSNNIFGCKACDCNPGGSTSNICEKKTGQCQCRPNITGRRCDRVLDGTFYVPTIRHLKFKAKDAKTTNGKTLNTEQNSDFVAISQHKDPIQWKLDLLANDKFVFIMSYRIKKAKDANVNISIFDASYGRRLFITSRNLNQSSGTIDRNSDLFVLREGKKDFPLTLYSGSYHIRLSTNESDLYVDYMALIPESYLHGDNLIANIQVPCTVFRNTGPCVKYSYLSVPRKGVYTIEVEGTGKEEAEMLDRSLYPSLSINGAIVLGTDKPFSISFKQPHSGNFTLLLQYFKPREPEAQLIIRIQGPEGAEIGRGSLANCPYAFACRHVMLGLDGVVKNLKLKKDATYTVTFTATYDGVIALDLLALIPRSLWSLDYIRPTPFCVAAKDNCIRTSLIHPEGQIMLEAARSDRYSKPRWLPPNVLNTRLRPIFLQSGEDSTMSLIRWNFPLNPGYFYALIHYYQPLHQTITIKVIIHTFYSSVAGKVRLEFCPHVEGCRAAVTEEEGFAADRLAGLYLTGSNVGVTITLPKGFNIWIDSLLFIRPSHNYDAQKILHSRQIQRSNTYRKNCLKNYDINPKMTKSCFKWLFQLVVSFNNGPSQCNCRIRGSKSASCYLIGGQCYCKKHVTGRTCSRCVKDHVFYPQCTKVNRLTRYLI